MMKTTEEDVPTEADQEPAVEGTEAESSLRHRSPSPVEAEESEPTHTADATSETPAPAPDAADSDPRVRVTTDPDDEEENTLLQKSPSPTTTPAGPHTPAPNTNNDATASSNPSNSGSAIKKTTPPTKKPASTPSTLGSTPGSSPKTQRGLRQFSVMVCKHVEEKGTTTYNDVADELVRQVIAERRLQHPDGKFDEKNIRRRVYDALNVLLAMDIIAKHKKDIIWKGLPHQLGRQPLEPSPEVLRSSPDLPRHHQHHHYHHEDDADLEARWQHELAYRQAEVHRKQEALRELLVQQVCFRNLVQRNQRLERAGTAGPQEERIPLPCIVVNTKPSAVIQCDMSPDKSNVMFDFDSPFEINDDNTLLKRMEMDKTTMPVLQELLPEDMLAFCQTHHLLDSVLVEDMSRARHPGAYHHGDRTRAN